MIGNESSRGVGVFILAKNEQRNIERCLAALQPSGWEVIVLDSGSTDDTLRIVSQSGFAQARSYAYVDHCTAYNQITMTLGADFGHVVILDADMIVSRALQEEIKQRLSNPAQHTEVLEAEIEMCVEGRPLRFGSLYPPKPFVFTVGREYFESVGHGEKLRDCARIVRTKEKLRHDDRKNYGSYLQSQLRYSRNLVKRAAAGELAGRDKIRTRSPLLIFAVPFVSYVLKGGFLDGKAGAIYALDRLIAEAIMYRRSLSGAEGD